LLKYWIWLATRSGLGGRGIYLVARHFPSPEQAYYAGTEEYEQIAGKSVAKRPKNSRLDKTKLKENGFTPLPAWQDALSRYLKVH